VSAPDVEGGILAVRHGVEIRAARGDPSAWVWRKPVPPGQEARLYGRQGWPPLREQPQAGVKYLTAAKK